MIVSCPSCQASFRLDASRLGPMGKKVRCSRCGHVWLAAPDQDSVSDMSSSDQGQTQPPAMPNLAGRQSQEAEKQEESATAIKPTLTARVPDDENIRTGVTIGSALAGDEIGDDGLTSEQRAKLAAARGRKQPRGVRFWIKVLLVFIVVVGALFLAQKVGMVPSPGLQKTDPAMEQPASDVPPVESKSVPAQAETGQQGGHIVGEPLPPPEQ